MDGRLASIASAGGALHVDFHLTGPDYPGAHDTVGTGVAHPDLRAGATAFQCFTGHAHGDPAVGCGDDHPVAAFDRLILFQLLGAEHVVGLYRASQAHADSLFRLQQVTSADLADIALAQCNVLRAEDGVTGEWSGEYHYRLEEVHLGGHKQAPLYLAAVAADPDRDPADGDFRALELGADRVRRAQRQTQPGVQAEIGRASCREMVVTAVPGDSLAEQRLDRGL